MSASSSGLQGFVLDIIEEIVLNAPSIEALIEWTHEEVGDALEGAADMDERVRRYMACTLARIAWNVTPQPQHGFRVMKMAEPGRNDRCVAGLSCKHKQCCGQMPRMPALGPEVGWFGLCEALPAAQLDALLAAGRLPDGMLHMVARRMLDTDPERVRTMLEPRFAGPLGQLNEDAAQLMWVLVDAYDELDKPRLKSQLLKRAIAEGRGALRADALQRTATILADKRDFKGAWEHFALAQRESPDDPSLSHLEVILLTDEGRAEEAAERAKFWLAKLKRQGWHASDPLMELLREAAAGRTGAAIAAASAGAAGPSVTRFVDAVRRALETPVVPGRVRVRDDDNPADGAQAAGAAAGSKDTLHTLIGQLKGMGMDEASARREAKKLLPELEAGIKRLETDARSAPAQGAVELAPEPATPPAREEYELMVDAPLGVVEAAWHRAWPVEKPFSTSPTPHAGIDPWDAARADLWIGFIEQTPEAAHSPDILDDWLIAVRLLDAGAQEWVVRELAQRVGARAREILHGAGLGEGTLPWAYTPNRPLLRLLALSAFDALHGGDRAAARAQMREMLRINPNDNHGLRDGLVNLELEAGEDDAALQVIGQYPDDISPDLCYGAVLAWYRKQDLARATKALRAARKTCGKIESYLLPARKAEPAMSPHGFMVGGDDEAWIYREEMRAVWSASAGALDWLKRN